jgi:hypothetical protein
VFGPTAGVARKYQKKTQIQAQYSPNARNTARAATAVAMSKKDDGQSTRAKHKTDKTK